MTTTSSFRGFSEVNNAHCSLVRGSSLSHTCSDALLLQQLGSSLNMDSAVPMYRACTATSKQERAKQAERPSASLAAQTPRK